eukprot:c4585_g2_i1.p1 GENE.c4585_g2_i1~~c4585_g2_i1.p1  ORF type:complete len:280 (-),score=140.71 c4585_g2_i1:35-853(-)
MNWKEGLGFAVLGAIAGGSIIYLTSQKSHKDNKKKKQSTKISGKSDNSAILAEPMIDKIMSQIDERNEHPICVGIAGGSGSGKTSLLQALVKSLGENNVSYLCHDSYYNDLRHLSPEQRKNTNFDHPASLDTQLLVEHIKMLKQGEVVESPLYDFRNHTRSEETRLVNPSRIIVVEGILVFADKDLLAQFDIKIFVDTEADIRLLRRIQRDVVERGRDIQSIMNQYLTTVKPMHQEFVEPSKMNADLIVPMGLNVVALQMLTSRLASRVPSQ